MTTYYPAATPAHLRYAPHEGVHGRTPRDDQERVNRPRQSVQPTSLHELSPADLFRP